MKKLILPTIMGIALAGIAANASSENFNMLKKGSFTELKCATGQLTVIKGQAEINKMSSDNQSGSLRLTGGDDNTILLKLNKDLHNTELGKMSFNYERFTGAKPFEFYVEAQINGKWQKVFTATDKTKTGGFHKAEVDLKLKKYSAFRFSVSAPKNKGVVIDDFKVMTNKPMAINNITASQTKTPLLIRKENAVLLSFNVQTDGWQKAKTITEVDIDLKGTTKISDITELKLYCSGSGSLDTSKKTFASATEPSSSKVSFKGQQLLDGGSNQFHLVAILKENASLSHQVDASLAAVKTADGKNVDITNSSPEAIKRIGFNVAHSGDTVIRTNGEAMVCKRMRIPGLATSNEGTLLGVYDLRWRQNGDLPGDIDIGLSRSTDGGNSWEDPRPVVDMKNYLGAPENKNGIGDPAILVNRKNGDIWISGLLAHGLSSGWYWGKSKPGMDPKLTGQVILSKSSDDGKTWSEPANITSKIKDPAWQLMLQGPGKGISMRNGTLVFAFQYKVNLASKDEKPRYSARSSIMYSTDQGKNWVIAPGVNYPSETTEAQVIELDDGSLMLNCRISRGGRGVFTTNDLGKTWKTHHTSGSKIFTMTGCMASIIRYSSVKDGDDKSILLFSGPDDRGRKRRSHMTIYYSLDEGESWSKGPVLDELGGAYSCMSLIDGKDVGILYEGSQSNMTFERLTIEEIMR